jgi:hypothetical protein
LSTPLPPASRASTTPQPAQAGPSGIPEVPSVRMIMSNCGDSANFVPKGAPSPPQSPPLAAYTVRNESSKGLKARRGGAAYTITEECERLFCETLKGIFYGEKNMAFQDSLEMGMHGYENNVHQRTGNSMMIDGPELGGDPSGLSSSQSSLESFTDGHGLITNWLEVYDYVGGARFRGFIAETDGERNLFVFFDQGVLGNDLKPG